MGSLTNSVKDIAAFPKVISAATTCHAAATTLSQGKFFILIENLANQSYLQWRKFTEQAATVCHELAKWEDIGSQP